MSDIPPKTKLELGNCDEDGHSNENGINEHEVEKAPMHSANSIGDIIFKAIGKVGSPADIHLFRQLNEKYYQTFNPHFLDATAKCITFKPQATRPCPCPCGGMMCAWLSDKRWPNNEEEQSQIENMLHGGKQKFEVFSDSEDLAQVDEIDESSESDEENNNLEDNLVEEEEKLEVFSDPEDHADIDQIIESSESDEEDSNWEENLEFSDSEEDEDNQLDEIVENSGSNEEGENFSLKEEHGQGDKIVECSESDNEYEKLLVPTVRRNGDKISFSIYTEKDGEYDNWTPKVAHIYRKLDFGQAWIGKLKKDEPELYKIVDDVAPYITSLRLNTLPFGLKNSGQKYGAFLNGFTNLKKLEIDYIYWTSSMYYTNVIGMSLDELEIGLANLNEKPNIKIYAKDGLKQILEKFATKENTFFEFNFDYVNRTSVQYLQSFFNQFGTLKNIKYNFRFHIEFFNDHFLTKLKDFTRICIQLDKQIQMLELNLSNFDLRKGNHNEFIESNQLEIKACLANLSPYIDVLKISQGIKPSMDILSHDSEWPKLTKLEIEGYNHPLQMLKKCSILKKLKLDVDQDLCLFANTQQTQKESLDEYFGNLRQLSELKFFHKAKAEDKIAIGNELSRYIKKILPQLKSIIYHEAYTISY